MARTGTMTVEQATIALSLSMVLLILVSPFAAPIGMAGVVMTQIAAFALPPIGVAARARGSLRAGLASLGVNAPRGRAVAGACLVGVSFWYLNMLTMVQLSQWLFDGRAELEQLGRLMFSGGEPAWMVVAVISIAPAVCEELLMRGAIARAIDARYGRVLGICLSAALFGVLHMSLVRFLPTATFGLVLAYAALASGSLAASVIIHLANNGIAVALASGKFPQVVVVITDHPAVVGPAAALLCGLGVVLLRIPPNSAPARP